MKFIKHTQQWALALTAAAFLVACGNDNSQKTIVIPPGEESNTRLKSGDSISQNNPICKDWHYNQDLGTLTFTESTNCGIFNGELHLEFAQDLIIERPKDPNYQVNSPFAAMEEFEGVYGSLLRVNGELFTGRIKGFNTAKSQVLDVWFMKGNRYGVFTVWSNTGRAYEKDFTQESANSIDLNTVRKPIIYFYPEQKTELSVRLDFQGKLTTTYPKYDEATGWKVTAMPEGTLFDAQGREYYALYWEGLSNHQYDLSRGFVVKSTETAAFLEEKLATLGLNRREANEFINYWLPELEQNPYNLIHFAEEAYTKQAPLTIEPQPESLIRVFMVYQPLQRPIAVLPQTLKTPQRQGFTVVEWGGAEQKATNALVR